MTRTEGIIYVIMSFKKYIRYTSKRKTVLENPEMHGFISKLLTV